MNLSLRFAAMAAFLMLGACSGANYEKTADGLIVKLRGGDTANQVQLRVVSERIVRVTATPSDGGELPASLMAVKTGGSQDFTVVDSEDSLTLKTQKIAAEVSLETGAVQFKDKTGKLLVAERDGGRSFKPVEIDGQSYYEIRQRFASPDDEAFYGLGQHQNAQMNYKNEDVELAQHNMDIGVPFVVSSRNYGILWDNNSITRFGDPRGYRGINTALKLYDADGKEGGLTARTDGTFSLYEDEGTNYNYEQGAYSRIPLSYDETKGELIIGPREGRYAGMPDKRVFNVRFISGAAPGAADLDAAPDATVEYSGATIVVAR